MDFLNTNLTNRLVPNVLGAGGRGGNKLAAESVFFTNDSGKFVSTLECANMFKNVLLCSRML